MENLLKDRITLITGVGRSAGIGAGICREIAKVGGDIFFTYWHTYDQASSPNSALCDDEDFSRELEAFGVRAAGVELDLTDSGSPERLFETVKKKIGAPDILINNACYDFEDPFIELSGEKLDKHYAINTRAPILLCKEFVKQGKSGHIVNMTSGQSLGSMGSDKVAYTTTKASLEMLVPQLAPELSKKNIKIYAVDPGPTDTGWMTEEIKKMIKEDSPRGYINTPEDIGRFIVSLITQDKYKTGEVIHVDR